MTTHLVWFRADLRVKDNLALAAACRDRHARVLALFISTPRQWEKHDMAARQAAFMQAHLHSLQHGLAEKGIRLLFVEVDDFHASVAAVKKVCEEHGVSHLFYNYQYEINERQRDAAVERALPEVTCQGLDDSVMLAPGSVMTGDRQMYKVFTPYKNAFLRRLREDLPECVPAPAVREGGALSEPL
ncbi:deoxyribodipyrimidine photo-lyase, partial [Pseudescherichia sp.]|uniref:deoxyribodipyrimidine photo-lyase n=1 Tax=Pseudescherichia sp. TaxID=2055881 RepID=UPI00289F9EA7